MLSALLTPLTPARVPLENCSTLFFFKAMDMIMTYVTTPLKSMLISESPSHLKSAASLVEDKPCLLKTFYQALEFLGLIISQCVLIFYVHIHNFEYSP